MDTLIVGYGSIGKRHARLLSPLVERLAVVTSQPTGELPHYQTLAEALAGKHPGYVVLCSPTHLHGQQLSALKQAGFQGMVLVEKPIVSNPEEVEAHYPFTVFVGYNLRFHPVITALAPLLKGEKVLSVHAYVGQHLAQWRPDRDVRATYSAHASQGGGVLRDLSHELDLLAHLFGELKLHAALVDRVGDVTVDSEDVAGLLLRAAHGPLITLQMNYLDPTPCRQLRIVTQNHSIFVDLVRGEITCDGAVQAVTFTADDSYRAMHQAALAGETTHLCTLTEGVHIVQLIAEAG